MASVTKLLLVMAGVGFTTVLTAPTAEAAKIVFSGAGTTDATTALNDFRSAIGGSNNVGGPKDGGFRTINWDAVKLDGTDVNPNTVVIDNGKTVAIPENRFQAQGSLYAEPYAVSGDGFASVNPDTAGQLPAFSPKNTFVMFDPKLNEFNDRFIEQSFTFAGTQDAAGTRGFGAIFTDVELAKTSSIEYFSGSTSLGKYYVEPGKSGDVEFLGVLFDEPVVTDVTLTVGTNSIFSFDGKTVKSFGPQNLAAGIDLAVTDDFVYAEPTTAKIVPEPATFLGTLVGGVMGAVSLFKNKKNKRKVV